MPRMSTWRLDTRHTVLTVFKHAHRRQSGRLWPVLRRVRQAGSPAGNTQDMPQFAAAALTLNAAQRHVTPRTPAQPGRNTPGPCAGITPAHRHTFNTARSDQLQLMAVPHGPESLPTIPQGGKAHHPHPLPVAKMLHRAQAPKSPPPPNPHWRRPSPIPAATTLMYLYHADKYCYGCCPLPRHMHQTLSCFRFGSRA